MTLTALMRNIGLLGLFSQGMLALILIAKRTWRPFPFFSLYVWLSFALSIAEYLLLRYPLPYFYVYWIGEAIGIALGFLVVYEIFKRLFTVHLALAKLSALAFQIASGVLLLAGLIVFLSQSPSQTSSLGRAVITVEQATRIMEVGLLMFLFICSAAFGLHWKQAEFGIALGLGFFATIELVAVTLRPLFGVHSNGVAAVMRVVAFDCSLFIWLGYLLMPERVSTNVEVPQRAQLEQWNQAVMELISK